MTAGENRPLRRLAMEACARSLDFSGRSSRRELAAFFAWAIGLDLALNLLARIMLEGDAESWVRLVLDTLLFLPVFALFARRLHDLGRSGWWMLFVLVAMARTFGLKALGIAGYPNVRDAIESWTDLLNWVLVPGFLIVAVAALFMPARRSASS
ncbi:DUF805 domain-containing protein [Novosphingobium pentaromativorans]|uniref:Uncharacterized protein n=1 Tax=Novosphingobium pentaromativorans US6-1 TaxID=1088721 RepID=G6EIK9_9SPHN|nr:DUF805 domain-containing protein [Novosphingobium pentaromativorans]AIT78827.1 hypothetical protein JI59_02870 [Novosphingobium pentaromativorans US6-1]EHJ58951.1 hypothetical protein NSU_4180 [Novosphingobium pentaromativorans US6-1]